MQEILSSKPKHIQIADHIRELINSGTLKNGERLLTDEELAKKYSVNRHTVAAGLKALVKEGLLERAPRRGTIVITDDSEGRKTSNAVGMVMLSKGDVYRDISRNIARGFSKHKLFPVLINGDLIYDDTSVTTFLNTLCSEQAPPYGYIIDGSTHTPYAFLKEHADSFTNLVFINKYHYHERLLNAKYALIDFHAVGRMIAEYFIKKGHRSFVQLAMPERSYAGPWSSLQAQVLGGILEVVRQSEINFNEEVFWKLLHGAPLQETLCELMSGENPPDAVFSYNDAYMRYEVLPVLKSCDKPIDVIGFYNTPHSKECNFSSVCVHEEIIAETAIKLLTNQISDKEVLIKPELIIRT